DAGGPAIREHAPGLSLERRQQTRGQGQVGVGEMKRRGELAFQMLEGVEQLLFVRAANDERRCTEDLFSDFGMLEHVLCRDREERAATAMHPGAFGAAREQFYARMVRQFLDTLFVSRVDAGREHRRGRDLTECGRGGRDELLQ